MFWFPATKTSVSRKIVEPGAFLAARSRGGSNIFESRAATQPYCTAPLWDPDQHEDDRRNRDALAARGYWQAFQKVKTTVVDIIGGANPGVRARASHSEWYREMFQPCVATGLIQAGALAGYRNDAVYLRTSRYVPPRWEAVRDAIPALFDLLVTVERVRVLRYAAGKKRATPPEGHALKNNLRAERGAPMR